MKGFSTSYYGRIDLENMPGRKLLALWERQARESYKTNVTNLTYERFESDFVWGKIADWQKHHPKGLVGKVQ